jgi:hypothetical protein
MFNFFFFLPTLETDLHGQGESLYIYFLILDPNFF